jgi:hypothetical protein
MLGKAAKQAKARNYPETYGVNVADRWKERLHSYLGRPHRRVETEVRNAVEIRFVMSANTKDSEGIANVQNNGLKNLQKESPTCFHTGLL